MNFDQEIAKDCQNALWMPYDDAEFLVNSFANLEFQRHYEKAQQPYRKQIEKRTLSNEKSLKLMAQSMARHIVLDWKDVFKDDGTPLNYTVERAEQLILNSSPFRDALIEFCSDNENFTTEAEKTLGNDSRPTQGGGPSGVVVSNS